MIAQMLQSITIPPSLNHNAPKPHSYVPNTLSLLDKPVSSSTYASILESYNNSRLGKQVHAHTLKTGFFRKGFVDTKLLQLYGKFGCLGDADMLFDKMTLRNLYDAKTVFETMPKKDRVSWNAIVSTCAINGEVFEAMGFFETMSWCENSKPNLVSWSTAIGGFSQNL